MRTVSLAGVCAVAFLAACSAGGSARWVPEQTAPIGDAVVRLAPWTGPVVYAAPTSRGIVNVYPGGTAKPAQALFSFSLDPGTANSLVVNAVGDLFLADSYSTWVFEYAPGSSTPMKRYPTTQTPFQIAVRAGTLYVFEGSTNGGSSSVAIYGGGKTRPTSVLTDPAIVNPSAMTVDGAGNVFVGYSGANFTTGIGEFVGGKMPMKVLKFGAIHPLAMAVDPAGNLLIDAYTTAAGSSIYIFAPEKTTATAVIKNLPWLYQISLTADGKSFYAGPTAGKSFRMYAYPSGNLIYSFEESDAFSGFAGIAASPAAAAGTW